MRSERSCTRVSSARKRYRRVSPSPPRKAPAPSESGASEYSSIRIGCSTSMSSAGMLVMLDTAPLCASIPSCRADRAGGDLAASLDLHPGLARVPLLAVAGHGEVAVGAAGAGGHLARQHLREGAEHRVRDPEAAEEPSRDRGGRPWIDVAPLRSGHRDGPEIAARVGDLPAEDGPGDRVHHRLGSNRGDC